jgi:acetoin utilization deacetylase AcuC-like enzyme
MNLKIFGDTTAIDWTGLGVKMPFAPMHELAKNYKLEKHYPIKLPIAKTADDIIRTFELPANKQFQDGDWDLEERIHYRLCNTVAALNQATSDTICINLQGGYTHAGKTPDTGYAYSLINDIIWAVDYQLDQGKSIGIIDLDFHFGGGTWRYYSNCDNPYIVDLFHPRGILHRDADLVSSNQGLTILEPPAYNPQVDKIILNLGTDWLATDPLFGKYGKMSTRELYYVWIETISRILNCEIPLAITCGGGYGSGGLVLYEQLITWLGQLV